MKWIGLTGGLGTGKSTVAKILRAKGYVVIDADQLAHLTLAPGSETLTKVLDRFGTDLIGADGNLDRRRLGKMVFSEPSLLAELEAIIHPAVKKLTLDRRLAAEQAGHKLAFYDVPLLFEKNFAKDFASVIVVSASLENQIARTIRRDGLSREEVLRRLSHQLSIEEKAARADFVIENNGSEAELQKQVDSVLAKLLSGSKAPGVTGA